MIQRKGGYFSQTDGTHVRLGVGISFAQIGYELRSQGARGSIEKKKNETHFGSQDDKTNNIMKNYVNM